MFQRSRDDNGILDEVFFGRNTGCDEFSKIAKIKFICERRPKKPFRNEPRIWYQSFIGNIHEIT
jgi:hypothetical protein